MKKEGRHAILSQDQQLTATNDLSSFNDALAWTILSNRMYFSPFTVRYSLFFLFVVSDYRLIDGMIVCPANLINNNATNNGHEKRFFSNEKALVSFLFSNNCTRIYHQSIKWHATMQLMNRTKMDSKWKFYTYRSSVSSSNWLRSQAMYSSDASVIRGHHDKSSARNLCKFSAINSIPSSVTLEHPDNERTVKWGNEWTGN